jgi:uncharacterized protein
MKTIPRFLEFKLPKGQSAFLWGPRKTGKSTFLKAKYPESIVYDFLQADLFFDLTRNPSLMRERLMAMPVSKLIPPIILDEVHWLIENKGLQFILCGSSARKLKRGHANLLGGRAWRYEMFPLVWPEIKNSPLVKILNQGTLPSHFLAFPEDCRRSLHSYIQDYLKEEVFAEGLVRNLSAFSRFFDTLRYSHGELINYSNIARDCGIDSKTAKEYFQILVDTLVGSLLNPYSARKSRDIILKMPKFYLFDTGVAGALMKRSVEEEKGIEFGRALKHFIFNEIKAYASYSEKFFDIYYWRSKFGAEVDFILGEGQIAVEVKSTHRLDHSSLKGLLKFKEDYFPQKTILVCNEKNERLYRGIHVLPRNIFLDQLWAGEII